MRRIDVKHRLRIAVLIGLVIGVPARIGWAWGPEGHRIVAYLAELRLDPAVLNVIRSEFSIKHLADAAH